MKIQLPTRKLDHAYVLLELYPID
uniref:Uncharacterized protein n=1 Tax=Anguilla anguilla TaxID=7936 RepID=A0A0E9TFU1_ANGAN